jgi:hypothetical protein
VLYARRSREQAIRGAHKRATPYLLRLLDPNSSRVTNDGAERVRESRIRGEIGTLLRAVTATARRGAVRAKASRERGGDVVREEFARLEALRDELGFGRAIAIRESCSSIVGGGLHQRPVLEVVRGNVERERA